MRRITLWGLSTVVVLVLLFSYRTSTSGPNVAAAASSGQQAPGVVGGQQTSTSTGSSSTSSNGTQAKSDVTVNGALAQTRWGPVQVQIHISGNRIVDVSPLVYPTGTFQDEEINSYALPILRQQVLQAQSARIQGVSGATVTSYGYVESLQAALDAAHFGG